MVRILVTTSHRPSQRVRSFAKDLASVLPEAVKVNRGKSSLRDLYYDAVGYGAERVVVIGVWKGNPGLLRVYSVSLDVSSPGLHLISEIRLAGVALRREIPGSQKIMGVRRLAIDATTAPRELGDVVDTFSRSFLASIVFEEERLSRFDVVLRVESSKPLTLAFYCTGTGRPCGPRLRVAGILDRVSGKVFGSQGGSVEAKGFGQGGVKVGVREAG